jgi:ribosome biogenesis GTPase A
MTLPTSSSNGSNSAGDGVNAAAAAAAAARAVMYEPEQLRREFGALLTELNDRAQTESVRDVVGNDLLRTLRQEENQLRARLAGDFKLVVLGDFKRGKSTLVNALLQTPIATTNVTPETVTINEIGYGSTLRAEVCLQDGGRVFVQPGELTADRLQPLIEGLSQPVSHLEIQAPVAWLHGVQMVDTPGLGDVFKRFDQQVYDYLHRADAVLFLLSPCRRCPSPKKRSCACRSSRKSSPNWSSSSTCSTSPGTRPRPTKSGSTSAPS